MVRASLLERCELRRCSFSKPQFWCVQIGARATLWARRPPPSHREKIVGLIRISSIHVLVRPTNTRQFACVDDGEGGQVEG